MYMHMYKLLLHTSYWYIYTCRIWNSFGTKPQNNCHVPWHDLILPVSPFPHLLHPLWRSLLSDHLAIFSYAAGTKIQAHYIFSKNLLLFTLHDLFQLVLCCSYILWIYLYMYVTFHKNLLQLNFIPLVCMIVNILNMSICIFGLMYSTTQWHIDISVSDLQGGINYQVHEENNTFGYHLSLFISLKSNKMQVNTHIFYLKNTSNYF